MGKMIICIHIYCIWLRQLIEYIDIGQGSEIVRFSYAIDQLCKIFFGGLPVIDGCNCIFFGQNSLLQWYEHRIGCFLDGNAKYSFSFFPITIRFSCRRKLLTLFEEINKRCCSLLQTLRYGEGYSDSKETDTSNNNFFHHTLVRC